MSFTYDINQLATSSLMQVRLKIGDTIDLTAVDESLHDEEINVVLSDFTQVSYAAYICAGNLLARLRIKTSRSVSNVNESVNEKIENLEKLRDWLKTHANETMGMDIEIGGISQSDNATLDSDTDAVQLPFSVGMHDKESWL